MPATAVHSNPTNLGFTQYARWIGRCKCCKATVKIEITLDMPAPTSWFPTERAQCECGAWTTVEMVCGTHSEKKCGARCQGATGPACDCSCGGENHGGR